MSNCVIRIDFYTDNSTLFLHICSISITSGKFSWILYFIIFFCFNNLFFNMELPIIKVIKLLYHLLSNLLNIFILFRLFKENTLIYELLDMFFFHSSSFCLWIIFASFLKMPLSMKVWTMLYRAIQGGRVMVESSDKRVPLEMVLFRRIEELTCGGMVEQVQEAFGETMTSVVSLCARYPIACANSIGLLCTIPYTR